MGGKEYYFQDFMKDSFKASNNFNFSKIFPAGHIIFLKYIVSIILSMSMSPKKDNAVYLDTYY